MERFSRTRCFLGEKKFALLQKAMVTIVGLGAVGGYAAEGLARAGIGHLRLVDFDTIQPSNINRQILALESTVGQAKVEAARERINQINPECHVEALQLFAADETLDTILLPHPDILIDAIDSLNPKVQLLAGAHQRGITTFSSMGAALRTDPSKIRTGDIMTSNHCPLARHVRNRLRRQGIEGGIHCIYSTERVDFSYQGPEETETPASAYESRGRKRNTLGSLPTITGIFGLILANEVILRLTKEGPTHS
ncbi:MAG: tRNA threonylcarbamoyladenosine dehydratase [Proteobacteria bacterium]|nr:tRNA threonylcarbamoyladenosine dehydratase [Pseudomonadota bacterium]MBU1232400.1 tRNA threonylcarbamoyladenosine dehydratase [Pseudomonadota bacterium]MBU1417187.1 tRNA threonylcarbamoyladenosine dehydratase [Pseudomonadota bacterium]MBU1453639.1 tRNA threonylcarbamoyladenosine dehydratase [Pseudomonadota bacterium]